MEVSRREFLAAGMGAAALTIGGGAMLRGMPAFGAAPQTGAAALPGEDGSDLWLRYARNPGIVKLGALDVQSVRGGAPTPTSTLIQQELANFRGPETPGGIPVIVGRNQLFQTIRYDLLGGEGFAIRTVERNGAPAIVITAATDVGALYGAFHLIRLLQTHAPINNLSIDQTPRLKLRLLNHWDNLDGTIERGYAGRSLWNWRELPGTVSPRLAAYARANASIGLNGAVLNNVNANANILTPDYLKKVVAIADVFRPWGVRVYLSANFSAPMRLGGLTTADPLNDGVKTWWKNKADEIYGLIPDFGGFLVKANSEGQPGPRDYKRSHAEGANVLADALAPHGGNVIWRAFIYDEDVDPDRAKRAYIEFTKLEGQFQPNVLVQVKNGAIDFMPREPFHPLFGALPKTPVLAELQATQEYLGQARHLVYLGTMWKEFLDADTFAKGPGSTVGKVLEGGVHPYPVTGMANVLNVGLDTNWCGHDFSQANWYVYGRLAWDHTLSAQAIAEEWIRQTFTHEPAALATLRDMMMTSRETFVDYTMPLGLHHLIGGDHYAPAPSNGRASRADWTATYYHQASAQGIGFNRTRRGNKAVEQYYPEVRDVFDDVNKCPEEFLLWFHRLPWDHRMKSGRTLWDELCFHYQRGAAGAAALEARWQALAGVIDARRHQAVAARLAIQKAHAAQWRDSILAYFAGFSGKPIPRA